VIALDLTEEYCDTARWLNRLAGLDGAITVCEGDVTDLPFRDGSFDVVVSQHVQMNVSDKGLLYSQAYRVLTTDGRLALWDVTAGTGQFHYPLPWADSPELIHLVSADQLRTTIEAAGFSVAHWNDLSEASAAFMEGFLSSPAAPLGLHTIVPNFGEKVRNLTRGLSDGNLRVIQGVARATSQPRPSSLRNPSLQAAWLDD
jgi:sarcosine/dimethylglycine N-methyltransferase